MIDKINDKYNKSIDKKQPNNKNKNNYKKKIIIMSKQIKVY